MSVTPAFRKSTNDVSDMTKTLHTEPVEGLQAISNGLTTLRKCEMPLLAISCDGALAAVPVVSKSASAREPGFRQALAITTLTDGGSRLSSQRPPARIEGKDNFCVAGVSFCPRPHNGQHLLVVLWKYCPEKYESRPATDASRDIVLYAVGTSDKSRLNVDVQFNVTRIPSVQKYLENSPAKPPLVRWLPFPEEDEECLSVKTRGKNMLQVPLSFGSGRVSPGASQHLISWEHPVANGVMTNNSTDAIAGVSEGVALVLTKVQETLPRNSRTSPSSSVPLTVTKQQSQLVAFQFLCTDCFGTEYFAGITTPQIQFSSASTPPGKSPSVLDARPDEPTSHGGDELHSAVNEIYALFKKQRKHKKKLKKQKQQQTGNIVSPAAQGNILSKAASHASLSSGNEVAEASRMDLRGIVGRQPDPSHTSRIGHLFDIRSRAGVQSNTKVIESLLKSSSSVSVSQQHNERHHSRPSTARLCVFCSEERGGDGRQSSSVQELRLHKLCESIVPGVLAPDLMTVAPVHRASEGTDSNSGKFYVFIGSQHESHRSNALKTFLVRLPRERMAGVASPVRASPPWLRSSNDDGNDTYCGDVETFDALAKACSIEPCDDVNPPSHRHVPKSVTCVLACR